MDTLLTGDELNNADGDAKTNLSSICVQEILSLQRLICLSTPVEYLESSYFPSITACSNYKSI